MSFSLLLKGRGPAGAVAAACLALLISGCSSSSPSAQEALPAGQKLTIVATTGMVSDLVQHVAGDHAAVSTLMASGVDPHLYKPTTSDISEIMKADLVFYSGLGLEGPMAETFERAEARGRRITAVTAKLPPSAVRHSEQLQGHADPHVWMDVALWGECLAPIVAALAEADPAHAAAYQQNADQYRLELQTLDNYIRRSIATIPEPQRFLVTAHDAFEYFSHAYRIPVRSVQGITTESEPGVDDVNSLVAFLVEKKIPALFVETSVSDRNLEAVLEGVKQRGASVAIGGRLFSDAMGPSGTYEGTYMGMLDYNATTITRALGGEAPERGLNGKLGGAVSSP